jgi:hypothetical protein
MPLLLAERAKVGAKVIDRLAAQDDRIPWNMYIGLGINIVDAVNAALEDAGFVIVKQSC